MRLQKMVTEEVVDFGSAARRALFGKPAEAGVQAEVIPGMGSSAATAPDRHLRVKVTMNLDGDILQHFKDTAQRSGRSYQVLINDALREFIDGSKTARVAKEVGEVLLADESFLQVLLANLEKCQKS